MQAHADKVSFRASPPRCHPPAGAHGTGMLPVLVPEALLATGREQKATVLLLSIFISPSALNRYGLTLSSGYCSLKGELQAL